MSDNFYIKIENEIKKTDFYTRESLLIDVLYFLIMTFICGTFCVFMLNTTIGWVVLVAIVIIFIFL